ncbi:MAG: UbiA family prenyltransferase [Candidatus Diapherotrites archaeon]|uniref:UbiA family prenyltransferase n=1 Tax=Candidatus Iainarchaeum sp. TaxID=3101447 RepID=A0A8T4L894_9ARCH|nr:UbiA family prenyltransferase [Candidatus Diapherotrites archaeon]
MRPLEWSKSLANMLLAAIVANGFQPFDPFTFALAFIAVGPCLWGGLYALNDFTDRHKDTLHPVKRRRPIPSGQISPRAALGLAAFLIALAFYLAVYILRNPLFAVCLLGMLVNQVLYTVKPFEFKKRPVVDLVSGSAVNPVLRFYSGWVLFGEGANPAFNAPWLLLAFLVGIQFGGYTLYKLGSKKVEKTVGYKSSIVLFGEQEIKLIAHFAIFVGVVSYFLALYHGILPLKFVWLGIGSLLLTPVYWKTLADPKHMDVKNMYRVLYLHAIGFILGFLALAFWA